MFKNLLCGLCGITTFFGGVPEPETIAVEANTEKDQQVERSKYNQTQVCQNLSLDVCFTIVSIESM